MKITWSRPIDPVQITILDIVLIIGVLVTSVTLPLVVLWFAWQSVSTVGLLLVVGGVTLTSGLVLSR